MARYANASEVDSSGVWDTPYVFADSIGFENRIFKDKHALVSPLSIPFFSSVLPEVLPVQEPNLFPISLAIASVITITVMLLGLGLLLYLIKRK